MMTEQYVGRVLDRRYQILEFIASGGMARVFRAVHVGTGRPLAVKILKPKARENPDNIRRFQREARLTATLEHENIIDIIDVQTDEEVYLVMELLAGVDLRVYLRRAGRLAWAEVRATMLQICDAMQFAHDRGVVHRDLKPANCFRVEPGGRIKVLDLGIARPIAPLPGDPSRITLTGIPTGTPAYMAPEHFCGRADVRTDIYSAGVLMFELLTGRRPFVGEDAELLRQIVNTPMPALTSVADDLDCPPDAGAVIERALAKVPEQRYASMRAFAGAIAALDAEPTASFVTVVEARSTLGAAEPVSSTAASHDAIDPTTMAIVRIAPPDPQTLAPSPFDAPPDPEAIVAAPTPPVDAPPDPEAIVAAPTPPVDAPPESAPIITLEAPQPAVTRTSSTDRRWLRGVAIAFCLIVVGLIPVRETRAPMEPVVPVEQLPGVAPASTSTPEVRPDDPTTPPTTSAPQFRSGDREHDDARAATPGETPRSDTSIQATADTSPNNAASDALLASGTSPLDTHTEASPEPAPKGTSEDRPDPATAEDVAQAAAHAAARARHQRQRAAERAVQGVLDRERVGALVSRVKVTVQWSAAGEVTEATVHSLPRGAERTGVEGRLRQLPAPAGAGPVRVDMTFELKLP